MGFPFTTWRIRTAVSLSLQSLFFSCFNLLRWCSTSVFVSCFFCALLVEERGTWSLHVALPWCQATFEFASKEVCTSWCGFHVPYSRSSDCFLQDWMVPSCLLTFFYFLCYTWFSLSSIVLLRWYFFLFNVAWVMLMYTGIQQPRLFISETKHWISLGFSMGWPGDHSSWFLFRTDWFLLFFWGVGWGMSSSFSSVISSSNLTAAHFHLFLLFKFYVRFMSPKLV